MENDILDSLNDLGYEGPLSDETAFTKALDGGAKSLEFTKLIHILAEEIKRLCNLEETVNMMDNVDESSSFLLELSSFLKELKCPFKTLVTGHMSSRLQTKQDRLLLLDYLISELMSARMVNVDCPKEKQAAGMEIVMQESPVAKALKEILICLKFNKPPPNITPEMLFSRLEAKLKDTIQKEGDQLVGKPLYNKALTEKDWKQLESSFTEMFEEYRLRRETLITRLECTIQSFEWSDRLKTKKDVIQSTYRPKRENLKVKPDIKLSDFLAARTSLLLVEKTSSATVRKNTQTDVNKVIIGQVPDRGGRPNEQQPPPPEMPSWQQRCAAGGGGRGGGRGGGGGGGGFNNANNSGGGGQGGHERGRGGRGGRGGRVQGGYSQGSGDHGLNNRTETTKPTRFPPVVTTTMANRPSTKDTGTTRTTTNMVKITKPMVDMAAGTAREAGMIVWAALIREDIKEAVAAAEAAAVVVATKSPTKTTKATSRTRAISPPTREATSPRAATSPEGATRTNTTTGTDAAGADTGGDVDIHNNTLYVACKVRSTLAGAHLQCVKGN